MSLVVLGKLFQFLTCQQEEGTATLYTSPGADLGGAKGASAPSKIFYLYVSHCYTINSMKISFNDA